VRRYAVLMLLALSAAAFAASWSGSFRFSPNSVTLTDARRDGRDFQLVQPSRGMSPAGVAVLVSAEPGKPLLPQWSFTLAIPQGMRVAGVDCRASGTKEVGRGLQVLPGQPPVPLTQMAVPPFVDPDPAVYGSDAAWPGVFAAASPVGIKSGFRLVTITLNPLQYRPASGLLTMAGELAVTVRYEPDPLAQRPTLTAGQLAGFAPAVRTLVYNPGDVSKYAPAARSAFFGEIDYVIITSDALASGFQPLVDWRTMKGFKTEIRTVAWITSNYSGRDTPEKIRNFIIDYYGSKGLRWVLLAGDNGVVPCREARAVCGGETGDIPADLYYADIQGTWDDDGDNIFGEAGDDEVDFYSDLYVGRASVDNSTQVQTFVNKVLTHEKNPSTGYLRRMLIADAQLWSGYNYRQSGESIAAITPSGWTDVVIHDPGTSTAVRDSINNGFQFVHLVGHGNEYGVYDGGDAYYNTDFANNQTNGDKVNFLNSIACYSGNFEYSECVAEAAHNRAGGGSIGVVFNSRYGWGPGGGVHPPGPSELLDIRFYDYFFNHDTMPIGVTEALSKEVYRSYAMSQGVWRWCYYEANLLGDPLLLMYENVPSRLSAAFTEPIETGSQSFTVTVTAASVPVANAIVCLYKGTEVYTRDYTNSSGQVTLSINPTTPGYMYVTATSANYLPAEDSCQVTTSGTRDVGVRTILAPAGTVDSGAAITPSSRVTNYGSAAATFPVTMRIGSGYSNTQTVTNLAPGDSVQVSFTGWTATARGAQAVRCSTGLAADQNAANDTMTRTVTVRVTDVGVKALVAPADSVDSGAIVTPQAWVRNCGTSAATFPATLLIGTGYSNTQTVTNLAPGDSFRVSFADWTATPLGVQAVRCSTGLASDQISANDTLSGSVTVVITEDVGVVGINKPAGTYGPREIMTPTATVRNYGNVPEAFEVWMLITDPNGALYYSDSVNVENLDPRNNLVVEAFQPCTLRMLGDWTARCSLALVGDMRLGNNVLAQGFKTRSQWVEMKSMPLPVSYKPVKDGAWLAYDAASGLIYAAKGNKSSDFYSYSIPENDWTALKAIPLGLEAKLPRRGACGVADGTRYVYMAKGNNTLGFWRYDIATDSWRQLANVPAGSHRKVKAGSAVYVQIGDSGYVYLLKGPTTEFYRFNVSTWTWETMQPAPTGSHSKWLSGSFLVFDGDHTIYAHKTRYHELWAYDVLTDKWSGTRLTGMPFVGRSGRNRKSRDGGTGAWFEGGVYALKGGSTSEFWRYDATAKSWTEFDELPPMAGSGKVRKVYAGASMVNVDGTLFALKGNKTNELWRYALAFLAAPEPSREGVMAATTTPAGGHITIGPSPLVGGLLHLNTGRASRAPATVRLYDASGRSVAAWQILLQNGTADFDVRHLAAGVYVVRVEADGHSIAQKLVMER
jgi:hypothetical protein